jgi:hypothetical protein
VASNTQTLVVPGAGPVFSFSQPCPSIINPAPAFGSYKVQIDSVTIKAGARIMVGEDTLLCAQIHSATCSVTPATATWITSNCPVGSASFSPTNSGGLVGEVAAVAMSSGINCNTPTYDSQNAEALAGGFVTYTGSLSTEYNLAPVDVIGDLAQDAWILSCTSGTVTAAIASPPSIFTYNLAASDWNLGIAAASTGQHIAALSEFLGIGGVPLQGLYDLNGDGGIPC